MEWNESLSRGLFLIEEKRDRDIRVVCVGFELALSNLRGSILCSIASDVRWDMLGASAILLWAVLMQYLHWHASRFCA